MLPQFPSGRQNKKYKCFIDAPQKLCAEIVPPQPTTPASPSTSGMLSHTCRKIGHSCLRNIISFRTIPGRTTFRRIGRAFMYGLTAVCPGYGIRDLSRGKDIILEHLSKQLPRRSPCPCCLRCGTLLREPILFAADAGQAFEMIKLTRIEHAF